MDLRNRRTRPSDSPRATGSPPDAAGLSTDPSKWNGFRDANLAIGEAQPKPRFWTLGNVLFGLFWCSCSFALTLAFIIHNSPAGWARAAQLRSDHAVAEYNAVENGLHLMSENDGIRVFRDNKTGCEWLESRDYRAVSLVPRTRAGPDGRPVQICE